MRRIMRTLASQVLTGLVSALVLCGCGTVVNPAHLTKPAPHFIVFSSPFFYDVSKEVDLPRPEAGAFRGLLAGSYPAVYEDDHGTYYRAPGPCVIVNTYPSKGQKYLVEGGIWIEKNSDAPKFRLYRILGLSPSGPSPIGDMSPCAPSSQVGTPVRDTNDIAGQIQSTTTSTPGSSSLASAVGTGIGYGLVAGFIEAEKGKLEMFPVPVGDPIIAGKFTRYDQPPRQTP